MKFDDLDARMRVFERNCDPAVLPGLYMVARIDGRNFTRLVRELHPFEAPFDTRFRDYMVETAKHLMNCGFEALFGYTQSDEISILFGPDADAYGRKLRKLHSILAGEASAQFTLKLGAAAVFDCRISQLPSVDLVVDYFLWRQSDATRNALNAHGYWLLRKQGVSAHAATHQLSGLATAAKNELLFRHGINFNDLPAWQKRGIGLYPETYAKTGVNPLSGVATQAQRKRLRIDDDLPMKDEFAQFLHARLRSDCIESV